MSNTPRNALCPCGSGKKYKRCCGLKRYPPIEKVSGILVDSDKAQIAIITRDMLSNQLRRDSQRIAESFDQLCDRDVAEMSDLYSLVMFLLISGMKTATVNDDSLRLACGTLLVNAGNSFSAALEILRTGYRLQPGVLIRSAIEQIGTSLHLFYDPNELANFEKGKLELSRTLKAANKVLPPFGQMWGFFSEYFVHVGGLHQRLQPLVPYTEKDEPLAANIRFLKSASWLLYVAAELLFLDIVPQPRYWQKLDEGKFAYNPSNEERNWMSAYLGPLDPLAS